MSEISRPREVAEGNASLSRRALPGFRVSDLRFEAKLALPSHFHPAGHISVILEGAFRQHLTGGWVECPRGTVFAKPPEERHRDHWPTDARHLVLEPGPMPLPEFEAATREVRYVSDPVALSIARSVTQELQLRDDVSALALEAEVVRLLARFMRSNDDRFGDSPPDWLSKVEERLRDDFAEAPSLDELATLAGVHRSHLTRTFKAVHGRSIGSFLRELRVDEACRRLTETSAPLGMVALQAGFADQSHMTRCLKRTVGMTPAVYRRAHGRRQTSDGP